MSYLSLEATKHRLDNQVLKELIAHGPQDFGWERGGVGIEITLFNCYS